MLKINSVSRMIFGYIIVVMAIILLWLYVHAMVWGPYLLSSVSWNA